MLNRSVRKAIDWVVGLALILLGVIGGFIPFLPGWVFVVAGLAVLSSHSRWAHALHVRFQALGRAVRHRVSPAARHRPPFGDDPPAGS
jgi:uncharacterized membrane protein YbaN (DUF454 family)